jgi:hypothetical protein
MDVLNKMDGKYGQNGVSAVGLLFLDRLLDKHITNKALHRDFATLRIVKSRELGRYKVTNSFFLTM